MRRQATFFQMPLGDTAWIPASSFLNSSTRDVGPRGSLEHLSQAEIRKLLDPASGLYPLFRKCALAVLNSGADTDNAKEIFDRYAELRHPGGAACLGHPPRDPQRASAGVRRRRDDPRHQGAPVRRAARRGVRRERHRRERPLRPEATPATSRTPCSTSCATPGCSTSRRGRISSCAGAAIPSATPNTSTRRRSGTRWACAGSMCARAADRAR